MTDVFGLDEDSGRPWTALHGGVPSGRALDQAADAVQAHKTKPWEVGRRCGICRRALGPYESTSLSRRDNETWLCSECGEREAMSDFQRGMVEPSVTQPLRISSVMVANSSQLRRLAGNSHRFSLGYGLDFRLDTVLASNGLHVLMLEDLNEDEALVTARCFLKVAHLGPEQPIEDILLSVRLRDWIRLQAPNPLEAQRLGARSDVRMIKTRDVIPDEWAPETPSDPTPGVVAGDPRYPTKRRR